MPCSHFFCLLTSSHFSLAVCLTPSNCLLLLLQGHCHPSNKQHTFLVMVALEKERERVHAHGGRQDTLPDSPRHDAWRIGGDRVRCLLGCVCVWERNWCSCSPLGQDVASVKWQITLITSVESLKSSRTFGVPERGRPWLMVTTLACVYTPTRRRPGVHMFAYSNVSAKGRWWSLKEIAINRCISMCMRIVADL